MHFTLLARALALATISTVVVALAPTPASAGLRCFGRQPTMIGTGGRDRLIGTASDDVIVGLGGQDEIFGRSGEDRLCGGRGADVIGGMGDGDWINGGLGDDVAGGHGANDVMLGSGNDDVFFGGPGNDRMVGGTAGDVLFGQTGSDDLLGGAGHDVVVGERGGDFLNGGPGFDLASFFRARQSVTASLATGRASGEGDDRLVLVEDLEGGTADDVLTGDAGENFIYPNEGDDEVDGRGSFDLVSFISSNAGVVVDLGAGTATGEGIDTLALIESVTGTGSADSLTGNVGPNALFGLEGPDDLFGLEEDDFLHGGAGADMGDGGPDGTDGDLCVDVETAVNCEEIEAARLATSRSTRFRSVATESFGSPSARHLGQRGRTTRPW